MSFVLDLSGIELKLDIRGYDKNYDKVANNAWCECDFSFKASPCLDYEIKNDELLLSSEVNELSKLLTMHLNGELCEDVEYFCLESDFVFRFFQERNVKEGKDICLEWCVYLWHDNCTENFMTFTLFREDIEKFRDYLISVKKNSLRLR